MFPVFVAIAAFGLGMVAAWFSVSGIAQLFIGAPLAATAMAISLEFGKVVGASYLYRYWKEIPRALKTYMTIGVVVLMFITSIGIYGYLSAAYATAAKDFTAKQSVAEQVDARVANVSRQIEQREQRSIQLQSIRQQQEDRLNTLVGKQGFITQQRIVRQAEIDIRQVQQQLDSLNAVRDSLTLSNVNAKSELSTSTKIGTFYYVSKTIGVPLDTIVKWFILMIVFVFDPMALALVMAFNALTKPIKGSDDAVSPPDHDDGEPPTIPVTEPSPEAPSIPVVNNPVVDILDESPHNRYRIDGGIDLRPPND
jgi:hypothetical protein